LDPTSVGKPPLFPDGIRTVLVGLLVTYITLRFLQSMVNLLRFGVGVLLSTAQTLASEVPVLRFLGGFLLPAESANTFVLDDSSRSLLQKSGDFRAREITDEESAEWVNAAVRKVWRLYPKTLSNLGRDVIQNSINENLSENKPPFVERIDVESVGPGDKPFWITDVEKLPTRIDSHLAYNFNFKYYGDAKIVLNVHLRGPFRQLGVTLPVSVSDIDLDVKSWVRAKLTTEPPYVYEVTAAFAEHPKLDVVIKPFKAVNVMAVPIVSRFLRQFLIREVPKQFVLPRKTLLYLDPNIADVSTFRSMLQQTDTEFKGVLAVTLYEAKELSGVGSGGLAHPFCYIRLNDKVIKSKQDSSASRQGTERAPVWNQQFEMLVKDPQNDVLEIEVHNRVGVLSRPVGSFQMRLSNLQEGKKADMWVPLRGGINDKSRLRVGLNYRQFVDDSDDEEFLKIREIAKQKLKKKQASLADEEDVELIKEQFTREDGLDARGQNGTPVVVDEFGGDETNEKPGDKGFFEATRDIFTSFFTRNKKDEKQTKEVQTEPWDSEEEDGRPVQTKEVQAELRDGEEKDGRPVQSKEVQAEPRDGEEKDGGPEQTEKDKSSKNGVQSAVSRTLQTLSVGRKEKAQDDREDGGAPAAEKRDGEDQQAKKVGGFSLLRFLSRRDGQGPSDGRSEAEVKNAEKSRDKEGRLEELEPSTLQFVEREAAAHGSGSTATRAVENDLYTLLHMEELPRRSVLRFMDRHQKHGGLVTNLREHMSDRQRQGVNLVPGRLADDGDASSSGAEEKAKDKPEGGDGAKGIAAVGPAAIKMGQSLLSSAQQRFRGDEGVTAKKSKGDKQPTAKDAGDGEALTGPSNGLQPSSGPERIFNPTGRDKARYRDVPTRVSDELPKTDEKKNNHPENSGEPRRGGEGGRGH